MGEYDVRGPELKKMIKLARKQSIPFGYNPGTGPKDDYFGLDKRKPPKTVGKAALDEGVGKKAAFGTVTGDGKVMSLTCLRDGHSIAKKLKKAKTDPEPLPDNLDDLKDRPEARNLVDIYAALSDSSAEAVITEYAGAQWGRFKPALAELAVDKLSPISTRMAELMDDPAEIDRILAKGADKAAAIAEPILAKTYDIVGFVRSR